MLDRPWTECFLDELGAFPEGKYLDQADAASGAFNWLAPLTLTREPILVPKNGGRMYTLPEDV